ncbi:MAG: adenylate/guanylate cyclase domain-containing protein, partial [Gemmatimonadota bacterium]
MVDATRHQLETAISGLESQRAALGGHVVDPALRALREQLARLDAPGAGAGARELFQEERKNVTVMFADLSGFTALAAGLDPEAARDLVNACFDRLVPVIESYGGTVDKFVGDAVVALFGAPVAHENDPERALRAALE